MEFHKLSEGRNITLSMGQVSFIDRPKVGNHFTTIISRKDIDATLNKNLIIKTNQTKKNENFFKLIINSNSLVQVKEQLNELKDLFIYTHPSNNGCEDRKYASIPIHTSENPDRLIVDKKYDLFNKKTYKDSFFLEKYKQTFFQLSTEPNFRLDIIETGLGKDLSATMTDYIDLQIKNMDLGNYIKGLNLNEADEKLTRYFIMNKYFSPTSQMIRIGNKESLESLLGESNIMPENSNLDGLIAKIMSPGEREHLERAVYGYVLCINDDIDH